jgi:preprotein translocase subunit YajC
MTQFGRIFSVVLTLLLVSALAGVAQAQTQGQEWQRVHATVQSVSGNTVTVKTDDGRTLTVDASQVSADVRGALKPNAGVTVIGFAGSDATKFTARFIQQDSSDASRAGTAAGQTPAASATASASASTTGGWQRVHGTVQSVSGNTMTFKTDDGRTLTVDAAKVGADIRGGLQPNDAVTLIGFIGSDTTKFAAEYIQKDASDPSRGGSVVGQTPAASSTASASAPVDEKAWQRIHGTVSSISGSTLSLKADDGRVINVDMQAVGEQVRSSLASGEGVTVIGFYRGNQTTVAAQYVQKDSSAGSASPPSGQKK